MSLLQRVVFLIETVEIAVILESYLQSSIDTRFVSPTLKQTAEAVEGFAQTVSNSLTIHVCIWAGSCTCCRNPSDTSAVTQPLHPLHQLRL